MIDKYKEDITKIDEKLKTLFKKRMAKVMAIADYKKDNKMPLLDRMSELNMFDDMAEDVFDMQFFNAVTSISKHAEIQRVLDKNIVLIGMMGSGKTTVGQNLALTLDIPFIDIDQIIELVTGMSISHFFENYGEDRFRQLESKFVEMAAACGPERLEGFEYNENMPHPKGGSVIATGGGVIMKESNMDALRKNGIVFFLDRPVGDILQDINTSTRPLFAHFHKLYEERLPLYQKYSDYTIVESPTSSIIDILLSHIELY